MKKMNNIAIIAMALAMALVIVVPVFAVSANQNPFTNEIVGDTTTSIPVIEIVENDNVGYITNDTIVNDEIVENDNVGSITNDSIVSDEIVESDDVHVCSITKANENRHIIDCDDCGEYEYVRHDELEASAKNEFFHVYECRCGYSYSEVHDFRDSKFAEGHAQTCIDCGYQKSLEAHTLTEEYYGYYHVIKCSDCNYVVEKHVGAKFQQFNEDVCIASCRECGNSSYVAHEYSSFYCDNCEYTLPVYVYGIVNDIFKDDDGVYTVSFMINGNYIYAEVENINFNIGDFVGIEHYGNSVYAVNVMVSAGIVDAPNAFPYYIHSDLICERNDNCLDNLVITEVTYMDDNYVWAHIGNRALGFEDYVVYNMVNGEMFDLEVGYAYLTFHAGSTVYFIAIW